VCVCARAHTHKHACPLCNKAHVFSVKISCKPEMYGLYSFVVRVCHLGIFWKSEDVCVINRKRAVLCVISQKSAVLCVITQKRGDLCVITQKSAVLCVISQKSAVLCVISQKSAVL